MYVRASSPAERAGREAGLRSSDAFPLRRSQSLLASSRERRPAEIARNLGCATQTVLQEARTGKAGVRSIACWLPTKSPWLNRTLAEVGSWQASDCRTCSVVDCQ